MLKKFIYYFPAISFFILMIWLSYIFGISSIENTAFIVEFLFILAGFLLSKKLIVGSFIGIIPVIGFILAGQNSKTGLETPIGIFVLIYFLLCIYLVHKSS